MKKSAKIVVLVLLVCIVIFSLAGCGAVILDKNANDVKSYSYNENEQEAIDETVDEDNNFVEETKSDEGNEFTGESYDNRIIGEWKNESFGYEFIYTFNEDGTGNYNSAGTDMPFKYEADGEKLSVLYDGDTVSFDTEYEIDGDVLNVKDSMGNDTLYKKLK